MTEKVLSDVPVGHWSPVGTSQTYGFKLFYKLLPLLLSIFFCPLCHLTLDQRQGLVGQTSCLCHQLSPVLSILPYRLNRWTFEWQPPFCLLTPHLPQIRHTEESSIFIPLPISSLPFLCFDSFTCKLKDKTYGANLQQINSDPL